ncbi:molecular chaperone HtpG [Saccharobesus litoralis]|uniref:Chaperone protein HtpG n=1 Tax=Saccharobesus litoralis TaxID=2172099 RepID=A0A2S0VV40_9ALTE|nr:molecular chaperone HtpG [Saccharobesus litoralis]AWB68087.1 molecular chaperone HtpG [Saccharobesus litoralis]
MSEAAQKETLGFQTEVKQLLQLMIHSLYSNKEIFLRELVSNASDAADKLRFKALENNDLYENDGDLRVRVSVNKDARTITIADNGIGMTREDVINNLGTIAKSGTADFFSKLSGDQAKDSQLIGQFGVGFYSAFIVADEVVVKTRAAGVDASQGVEWTSKGEGDFTIADIEVPQRGTEIILHLREDEDEFLDDWKVRSTITRYSDHINIPVQMFKEEVPAVTDEEGNESSPAEPAKWEAINKGTALWTCEKADISEDEYKEFYKTVAHDFDDPLTWSHSKVEGKTEYTSLLYIPKRAPFNMWDRDTKNGIKLYVQRVFIMDDAEKFLPSYLRFVKGLVDSNDLPLNVSREILQDNKITQSIRSGNTKKILSLLDRMAKNEEKAQEYATFWKEFGNVLKEGPAEDFANKEKIAKLFRFASTHNDTAEQSVGLDAYIERMKEGQDKIYYITADSFDAAKNSPHLEIFRKKGIEVLLMSDRIDEWLMSHLTEYSEKQFQSVAKANVDLSDLDDEETKKEQEETEKEFSSFVERAKTALGDKVKDVKVSHRLTESPAVITTDENDMNTQMAKLLEAAGQAAPETKYIFEVNPEHALVKRVADEADEEAFKEWVDVLFLQATLAEKGSLEDPASFVSRLNKLLLKVTA